MVSAQARREQVSYAIERGLSQRMACALLSVSRSNLYYSPKMPVKDAPVMEAMKTLSVSTLWLSPHTYIFAA